jgi:hypothetical protein
MRGLLVALLLPGLFLASTGCQDKSKSSAGAALATAGRKTVSRADFEKAVMGKSTKEVSAQFGEPDLRVPAGNNEQWTYASLTTNGAKTDISVQVNFESGKVTKVNFIE